MGVGEGNKLLKGKTFTVWAR